MTDPGPAPAKSTVIGMPPLMWARSSAGSSKPSRSFRRRMASSLEAGVPRLIRIWFSRSPLRTRMLKVRGEISA